MNNLLKIIEEGEKEFDRQFPYEEYQNTSKTQGFNKEYFKSFQKSQTIKLLEGIDKMIDEISEKYPCEKGTEKESTCNICEIVDAISSLLSDIINQIEKK